MRLFEQLRQTRKVSVFPVGALSILGVSSPILDNQTGRVIDFHDPYDKKFGRKFAMDMAGFGVNLQYFLSLGDKVQMNYLEGDQEDSFIKSLQVELKDLEPLASNCTEVLVWHVQTKPVPEVNMDNLRSVPKYNHSNLPMLYHNMMIQ